MSLESPREPEPAPSAPLKLKRSRNGCVECRRLHRRCDEQKPACASCRAAGKECSYQKPLSWGGRPFGRSAFRHALGSGVVEIPIAESEDDSPYRRSFVYGQPSNAGSSSNLSQDVKTEPGLRNLTVGPSIERGESSDSPDRADSIVVSSWVPWLSHHHRMLFAHFIESAITMLASSPTEQQEIRNVIVPMAVETNHGFSLLAAIISLASTHRLNLGLHKNAGEIEYWRDMSVGHLRRPVVQEDESTENVFAATALLLAIRDVIAESEHSSSWRIHLQGALSVLARDDEGPPIATSNTRRQLKKIARSLQIRSPLPPSSLQPGPGDDRKRPQFEVEILGFPNQLASIFQHIRSLRFERSALKNIESSSGSSNMQPLWNALRAQYLPVIVELKAFCENAQPDAGVNSDSVKQADQDRLYGYVGLILVYSGILDLRANDTGLRSTLETAVETLRKIRQSHDRVPTDLVFALFVIGALVAASDARGLVQAMLTQISVEHGKCNAITARESLQELWAKFDASGGSTIGLAAGLADVDRLMADKCWDLSLW